MLSIFGFLGHGPIILAPALLTTSHTKNLKNEKR